MSERSTDKRERLAQALERGLVMIHLDARCEGVVVPAGFACEAHLRLNLSYRFPAPEITLSDNGVRATLSFGGKKFRVTVPWTALFAIRSQVTQEFWTYPDDIPSELLEPGPSVSTDARESEAPSSSAAPVEAQAPQASSPDEPVPPRRHLRLVK